MLLVFLVLVFHFNRIVRALRAFASDEVTAHLQIHHLVKYVLLRVLTLAMLLSVDSQLGVFEITRLEHIHDWVARKLDPLSGPLLKHLKSFAASERISFIADLRRGYLRSASISMARGRLVLGGQGHGLARCHERFVQVLLLAAVAIGTCASLGPFLPGSGRCDPVEALHVEEVTLAEVLMALCLLLHVPDHVVLLEQWAIGLEALHCLPIQRRFELVAIAAQLR